MDEDLSDADRRPVTDDLGDLLPLFLDEAGARLDRLASLLAQAEDDPGAAVQVRRELHALKGAARMMGLTEIAELCHRTEDVLCTEGTAAMEGARALGSQLAAAVEDLRDGVDPDEAARSRSPRPEGGRRRSEIRGGSGEVRVATRIVDGLAERGARLRVAARSSDALAERLFEMAHRAERGLGDSGRGRGLEELGTSLRRAALELERVSRTVRELTDQQLEVLLRLQVQPLRPFLRTLARHTLDLARSLGKEVTVATSGGDVQLDRGILEAIREASLHLIRNAVDHGIESGDERAAGGKSRKGRIRIEAATEGDRVRLVVADDGRGIDPEEVVAKALERGLVSPQSAARLTADEAFQLLELPGFTTRDRATDLSGRGIGMDAVAAAIRAVGGELWIRSTPGKGAEVTVELPVTRRGERLLVMRVGTLYVAVPSAAVHGFSRLQRDALVRDGGRLRIRTGTEKVNAVLLARVFGKRPADNPVVIETNLGGAALAVVADAVVGEEEVFVRTLPASVGAPVPVEGVALAADGRPVAVLSLQRLGPLEAGSSWDSECDERPARLLLVEDARASREMLRRLLEDAGFDVTAAASVAAARARLEDGAFDCLITDVELPDGDGIGLIDHVRSSGPWSEMPVVVITTRNGPGDRLAGLSAGADAWFAKADLEVEELVGTVRRLAGRRSDDAGRGVRGPSPPHGKLPGG